MKTLRDSLLLSSLALLGAATLAWAAVPAMDVTISDSTGKVVSKLKTDSEGLFTTNSLRPGNYVVQFNSKSSGGGPFALLVSAGKKKTSADSVAGSKFVNGGVAMRVAVDTPMSLVGQVAPVGHITLGSDQKGTKSTAKVKYVNGKKFVWVQGTLGSNLGGRWVEAGSVEAQNVQGMSSKDVQDAQQQLSQQSAGGGR